MDFHFPVFVGDLLTPVQTSLFDLAVDERSSPKDSTELVERQHLEAKTRREMRLKEKIKEKANHPDSTA